MCVSSALLFHASILGIILGSELECKRNTEIKGERAYNISVKW